MECCGELCPARFYRGVQRRWRVDLDCLTFTLRMHNFGFPLASAGATARFAIATMTKSTRRINISPTQDNRADDEE